MAASASPFPPSAATWLTAPAARDVAAIGLASFGLARRIAGTARLTVVDREPAGVAAAAHRVPGTIAVAAAPDATPFMPCVFDQVIVVDLLHTLPPRLALAEFARVLRPGGSLAVVHTARDDSVPWVRRLAGIVRRVDPEAMAEATISTTEAALHDNPYFPLLQRQDFRRWVPADKPQLLAMVERLGGFADADPEARQAVVAETGALYDSVARVPDPLLLPYTISCWRGQVDHTELTAPLQPEDVGLRITL
ncbi:MAG: methyltransferase domain-containing protein [Propionicimonas sp.]|nr:methyltransferase domain-containing protein [Propionicimonas sp.]